MEEAKWQKLAWSQCSVCTKTANAGSIVLFDLKSFQQGVRNPTWGLAHTHLTNKYYYILLTTTSPVAFTTVFCIFCENSALSTDLRRAPFSWKIKYHDVILQLSCTPCMSNSKVFYSSMQVSKNFIFWQFLIPVEW